MATSTTINRFTASVIYKLMGNSRSGGLLSQTATTFVYEKAAEILTGISKPIYGDALDWGKDHEAEAFQMFNSTSLMSGHTTAVRPMYLYPTEIIAAFLPMGYPKMPSLKSNALTTLQYTLRTLQSPMPIV
jgi:hypothetical protein